jgi:uncharacterized protein (UPF0332 family)
MTYGRFLKDNLVKEQKPDFRQIEAQLKRARKDLKTAEEVSSFDLTWAYTISYHAMLRAGRALMYANGFLPTVRNTHKTIVEFTKIILGEKYANTVARFSRMRRERHDFIYDARNGFTLHDVSTAIATAGKLIDEIVVIVNKENPQKEFRGHIT